MKKINIALIRGAFLNPWEMQNYQPLKRRFNLVAFSSLKSLMPDEDPLLPERLDQSVPGTDFFRLPSPMDLPNFPYKMPVLNRLFIDAHWLWGLEQRLNGFDIAHVAETYYSYTHQAIIAKRKGIIKKVISTCWEIIPHNNEGIWGRKNWKKEALKEIDHFICPTEMAKRCLIEEGCQPEKINVIRMGVDLAKFYKDSPCVDARSDLKRKLNILFIGRLEKEKGIWELLEAFGELRKKYQNISLTLVGKGKEEKNFTRSDLASTQGLTLNGKSGQIQLIGKLNYEKTIKEYQKADIFVLPSKPTKSWQEQYGMVLVEAMAAGLPIVATKTGAIPEVLGNVGILVKPDKPNELIKALSYLLDNPKKRVEEGRRGRRRAERFFDREKIAEKIGKIYKEFYKDSPCVDAKTVL